MKRLLVILLLGSIVALSGCGNVMQGIADLFKGSSSVAQKEGNAATEGSEARVHVADADGDGIPDMQDECAGTPGNTLVDAMGCPVTLYLSLTLPSDERSAALTPQAAAAVERIGVLLDENSAAHVRIEGHTDSSGDPVVNQYLSEQRAKTIKDAIVSRYGIAPERIEAVGFGASRPLVSNYSEQGRARNRRVQITVNGYYSTNVTYVALQDPTDVHFALGASNLGKADAKAVAELADVLRKNSNVRALIEGHTDNIGDQLKNMELSKQRAGSVRDMLVVQYNIAPDRLETKGFGDTRPVADNATEQGRFQNRRVTITLQKPEQSSRAMRYSLPGA